MLEQGRAAVRRVREWDLALMGVLLVAAVARLLWPGLYQLKWDEVHILDVSLRLARDGEWVWLSNHTSWSVLPGHSPLNNYVMAFVYLFTLDPCIHRLFIGLLGVAAVGIMYWTIKRYFGLWAAIITGLLLATAPPAVEWSRYVWNPNLAQPFLALWLLTGLLGYYEGRRWAQITHWLALSLAVQPQIGFALHLVPLSGLLILVGWFRPQADRRTLVRATALGWGLAFLSVVPWVIGMLDAGLVERVSNAETEVVNYSDGYIRSVLGTVVSSTEFWGFCREPGGNGWWPPVRYERVLWLKTWLTVVGVLWLLIEVRWRRREAVPSALLALMTCWPLVSFPLSPIPVVDFYLMPMMFGALAVQAIILTRLATFRRWARWPVLAFVCAVLAVQGWLLLGTYDWLRDHGKELPFRVPLSTYQDLLDDWKEESDHLVVLVETPEFKFGYPEQGELWHVVGRQYGLWVIHMPQGIPIHPQGQVLVSNYAGTLIPTLFGEGETTGTLSSGQPMFRKFVIPAGYQPEIDWTPENISLLANGARILGLDVSGEPQPGQLWPVVIAWTPEQSKVGPQYQFSVRLVGEDGTTYAQMDGQSLTGSLWRAGDLVLNRFELPVSESLPPKARLRVQLLMYTWPDIGQVDAVNDDGAVVAPWLYLIPAQSQAAAE